MKTLQLWSQTGDQVPHIQAWMCPPDAPSVIHEQGRSDYNLLFWSLNDDRVSATLVGFCTPDALVDQEKQARPSFNSVNLILQTSELEMQHKKQIKEIIGQVNFATTELWRLVIKDINSFQLEIKTLWKEIGLDENEQVTNLIERKLQALSADAERIKNEGKLEMFASIKRIILEYTPSINGNKVSMINDPGVIRSQSDLDRLLIAKVDSIQKFGTVMINAIKGQIAEEKSKDVVIVIPPYVPSDRREWLKDDAPSSANINVWWRELSIDLGISQSPGVKTEYQEPIQIWREIVEKLKSLLTRMIADEQWTNEGQDAANVLKQVHDALSSLQEEAEIVKSKFLYVVESNWKKVYFNEVVDMFKVLCSIGIHIDWAKVLVVDINDRDRVLAESKEFSIARNTDEKNSPQQFGNYCSQQLMRAWVHTCIQEAFIRYNCPFLPKWFTTYNWIDDKRWYSNPQEQKEDEARRKKFHERVKDFMRLITGSWGDMFKSKPGSTISPRIESSSSGKESVESAKLNISDLDWYIMIWWNPVSFGSSTDVLSLIRAILEAQWTNNDFPKFAIFYKHKKSSKIYPVSILDENFDRITGPRKIIEEFVDFFKVHGIPFSWWDTDLNLLSFGGASLTLGNRDKSDLAKRILSCTKPNVVTE